MYCNHCGAKLDDNGTYCPICGTKRDVYEKHNQVLHTTSNNDEPHALVNLLCFFIPVLALFLFLVWLNTFPKKSKEAAKWGITGILARVCFSILFFVFFTLRVFF